MSGLKKWIVTLLLAILMTSIISCEEKGPMEKLGEKADKAVEDVKKSINSGLAKFNQIFMYSKI
ncbi:MAG: hypothetical protein P1P89_19090 [Desulfobacterales bacterium]|nr:hypothetical protein [Desulfobacterales bacterium]